ncbi:MAG: valine--tRNA ligase [Desulfurella sp.]|uniref:valine--tRNA ligase n=1 Tax=Desulfurella sp. TaxID=1962857 RepID=UPI003D108E7A
MDTYNSDFEKDIYRFWEENDLFKPEVNKDGKPFSMVIPPPNVTGALHIGHALNQTLQDIFARYKRMCGYSVLWLPGTDHAGIATQTMVERDLAKKGIKKEEIGRDAFIEKVWEWKNTYGNRIIDQIKRLGASCDFSRLRFTMDEGLSRAVRKAFVELYNAGYIYKGEYIINWCPSCHTALSDLEVEYEEENSKLYYLKYFLENSDDFLVVATTRPETLFGDTAVAVNPKDERYKHLVGKKVVLPLVNKLIEIIEDEYVDMSFGSGVVKITPAHDVNDFEVGKRHNLDIIIAIDDYGKMTHNAPGLEGVDRFEARKITIEKLKEANLIYKIEDYVHSVGHCYRCGTVIEPYISKQWFVKTKDLAKKAIEVVENGSIKFIPKHWEKTYFEWMYNIKDWCISRQIWWGHRIPAYTCKQCGEVFVSENPIDKCPKCSGKLIPETDVLDTWFSSALWPFSTLGWPDNTEDLKKFYPTSLLVTGFDIIFFWVARMIMMGMFFMNDVPFKDVYIHALVRDKFGQKMSKTKGNVIDPLDVIEKYGADSLRFTLAILAAQGRDIKLSYDQIESYRRFMNKIWNAYRFIEMNTKDFQPAVNTNAYSSASLWIKSRLSKAIEQVRQSLDDYKFNEAADSIYQFVWHEFCDYYIEMSKAHIGKDEFSDEVKGTLLEVFEQLLRLLHPFVPFISEFLWQKLPNKSAKSIMIAKYPHSQEFATQIEEEFECLIELIKAMRILRSENTIAATKKLSFYFRPINEFAKNIIEKYQKYVLLLANAKEISIIKTDVPKSFIQPTKYGDIFLEAGQNIDVEGEILRLKKVIEKAQVSIDFLNKRLRNQEFISKAPKQLIEKSKKELQEAILIKENTKKRIEQLQSVL